MNEYIKALSARLPELSWRLGLLNYAEFNSHKLPRGLFKKNLEMTPQSCIDEILDDLKLLETHRSQRSDQYLAKRVSEKINVLVQLCQMSKNSERVSPPFSFTVDSITTRQQWLARLTKEMAELRLQEEALMNRLAHLEKRDNPTVILNVQAELGEINRRLTVAQETLSRAMA
jgi:hypothetical protein